MSFEIIIYLAAMAAVYFFANYRGSIAYAWIVIYFFVAWPIEDNYTGNLSTAYILLGLALIAICELLVRFEKDPFTEKNLQNIAIKTLHLLGKGPVSKVVKPSNHRLVGKAYKLIHRKSWSKLEKLIHRSSDEERYILYKGLADKDERPVFIDQWLSACPGSDVAARMSGFSYIATGWFARGSRTADMVTASGWQTFFIHLDMAAQDFERANQINDNCYTSYIGLITIAMGSQIGAEKLWAYFAKGSALSPNNFFLHSAMIHACAPKWGGDTNEMFSVATQGSENAPDSNAVVASLAVAHVEQWLSLGMMDEEYEHNDYFRRLSVKDDLKKIVDRIESCDASAYSTLEAKNVLAFCLEQANMAVEFRELVSKVSYKFVEYPWYYSYGNFLVLLDSRYAIDAVRKKHGLMKAR